MTKTIIYKYLGTNGIIESPVYLEGIYSVKSVVLTADEGKILVNGKKAEKVVRTTEAGASAWKEVSETGQN